MGGWRSAYDEHVLPRLVDLALREPAHRAARREAAEGLHGRVVEIGFGTGTSLPHYPPAVTGVVAVEPSDGAWRLAAGRVAAAPVPVERGARDAQALPFADGTFDSALSTWTLCTVPDPLAALLELRRVLRPGGRLHLLEHGRAPTADVRAWQRRLDPVQRRVAGGCRMGRPVDELVRAAGFGVERMAASYLPGPRPLSFHYEGVVVAPG